MTIEAPVSDVWDALINPEAIKQYMFGTTVISDWREGSPITWRGEWHGKQYEDRGTILQAKPGHLLQYTHFSPASGLADAPEHYHTVSIELTDDGRRTGVLLTQDNNGSTEERQHAETNWAAMLAALKRLVETHGGKGANSAADQPTLRA